MTHAVGVDRRLDLHIVVLSAHDVLGVLPDRARQHRSARAVRVDDHSHAFADHGDLDRRCCGGVFRLVQLPHDQPPGVGRAGLDLEAVGNVDLSVETVLRHAGDFRPLPRGRIQRPHVARLHFKSQGARTRRGEAISTLRILDHVRQPAHQDGVGGLRGRRGPLRRIKSAHAGLLGR